MSNNGIQCPWGYEKVHQFRNTECCEDEIDALKAQISNLENEVQDVKLDNATEVTGTVMDTTKNFKITSEVSKVTTVNGKSIYMDGASVNSATLTVQATDNVEVKDTDIIGDFPGNGTTLIVKDGKEISFKNMKFSAKSYNGVNIYNASKITFEDCVFDGELRNNCICIFGVQDNTVIDVKNCEFGKVSNAFRFSNDKNAKNVVMNITNCKVSSWDANPEYAGMMICQDYTSKTADECVTNNLFAPEKFTVNVENVIGPDGNTMVDYVKKHGVQNTVVYVWQDKSTPKAIQFSEKPEMYPTVNVK